MLLGGSSVRSGNSWDMLRAVRGRACDGCCCRGGGLVGFFVLSNLRLPCCNFLQMGVMGMKNEKLKSS